jgi:hypothetical protein
MDALGKIFGSINRVKIMRLFLFNPEKIYTRAEISARLGLKKRVMDELNILTAANFVKRKFVSGSSGGKRLRGWMLNPKFIYLAPVRNLLIDSISLHYDEIIKLFNRAGSLKLLVVAGIFVKDPESRVDLLIVGDRLRRNILESAVRRLERDIGTEIRFAVLETKDFNYRCSVSDKLVRDILEFPHTKLINRLGLRG